MPTCKKCSTHFPNFFVIDGKRKNLGNRKYCLTCSPWGNHNTRKLDDTVSGRVPVRSLTCLTCGRGYQYHHSDPKGHTTTHCNSCKVNVRRFALKDRAIEYKGGQCEKCSYKRCKRALSFHHKDPTQKDFQISGHHCRKWEVIRIELDKCMLLCSNCHMEEHDNIQTS